MTKGVRTLEVSLTPAGVQALPPSPPGRTSLWTGSCVARRLKAEASGGA